MSERELHGSKASDGEGPNLIAYRAFDRPLLPIVPAGRWRNWMESWWQRWPNRCLPLLMANQNGWWILNTKAFTATWDGTEDTSALKITYDEVVPHAEAPAESHFGGGIITWPLPYLFRTDPGWNLLARGPANVPKDGVSPLEGLVETDWAQVPFTMNWKITREAHPVRFEAGEPICQIVPQRRGELESFLPRVRELDEDGELKETIRMVGMQRQQLEKLKFLARHVEEAEQARKAWQSDYFRGRTPGGSAARDHQTKLELPPFQPGPNVPSG